MPDQLIKSRLAFSLWYMVIAIIANIIGFVLVFSSILILDGLFKRAAKEIPSMNSQLVTSGGGAGSTLVRRRSLSSALCL